MSRTYRCFKTKKKPLDWFWLNINDFNYLNIFDSDIKTYVDLRDEGYIYFVYDRQSPIGIKYIHKDDIKTINKFISITYRERNKHMKLNGPHWFHNIKERSFRSQNRNKINKYVSKWNKNINEEELDLLDPILRSKPTREYWY